MSWEAVLGVITAIIPILDSRRAQEQEHVESTLSALGTAYYATQAYFSDLEGGAVPSRREQMELAEKWDRVSILIRRYDQNLSSRLSLKSRFWREGGTWDRQQILHANIGLENVRRDGRVMLMLKQRTG
ncbi:hypothetical protein ACF8C1_14480 [Pseudomonas sp. zjy_9]